MTDLQPFHTVGNDEYYASPGTQLRTEWWAASKGINLAAEACLCSRAQRSPQMILSPDVSQKQSHISCSQQDVHLSNVQSRFCLTQWATLSKMGLYGTCKCRTHCFSGCLYHSVRNEICFICVCKGEKGGGISRNNFRVSTTGSTDHFPHTATEVKIITCFTLLN